ncbi:MAG: transglutaminase domain-containing protein [Candidatus Omnitrophica bacterium]|nr:transglutaminase domain-containing protein [Candidatus Omnitrophota bacterium]
MYFTHMGITRAHWVVLVVLLGGGWLVLESRGSALASRAVGSGREVTCTYQAQIKRLPHDAHTVHVWIPLAKTGREQRILRRDVHAPVPYTIAEDPDYGNDILHATLEPPIPEHLVITVDYHAQLVGDDVALADSRPSMKELHRSLQPSGLVIIDDAVRTRARQATAGRLTRAAQARGIYDQVRQAMAYDKTVPGWGRGDTRRACLLGKGNCTDFHSLFISMARAQWIPARFKIGVVIPQAASGTIPGYHCWAEFYEKGQGWVPVDASEARKHPELADYYFGARDPNRLLISTGRDIQLVPQQQGEPVNIFFAPYVEVDGQVFPDASVEVRFTDLQQGRRT